VPSDRHSLPWHRVPLLYPDPGLTQNTARRLLRAPRLLREVSTPPTVNGAGCGNKGSPSLLPFFAPTLYRSFSYENHTTKRKAEGLKGTGHIAAYEKRD
jgi:hypothetical protein